MTFPPGSTLWLLAHELRLWWRRLERSRAGGRAALWISMGVIALLVLVAGVPLGLALRDVDVPVTTTAVVLFLGASAMIFALMLSQTLASAADALYQRGDLDLLFSSPLDPRRVLAVRFLAVALQVFLAFAGFLAAFLAPVALIGHPNWLAAFVVLASLALIATALGLVLAMGLFALIGPRRTRTVAQLMAAFIGAAFFLTAQARNILGGGPRRAGIFGDMVRMAQTSGVKPPPLSDWPLRAAMGEPLPLLSMAAAAIALFAATSVWLGRRFAADAAAASGADAGGGGSRARVVGAFAQGPFAVTLKKELRLLRRDAALLSQVLLRVLYLLPLGFVMIRNAGAHQAYTLEGGAAALSFMAGQVAGSLTWITVSAEDAPELLASAPTPSAILRRAKLSAAMLILAVPLAPMLAALCVLAPVAGVAASAGCAASALASSLVVIWLRPPGRRTEFRRQRSGSLAASLAELAVQALIAGATGLAAAASPWMLAPAGLAGLSLFAMRRSDAQIAEAVRATG